ncbi:MAG: ABC transporter ATP-binding protein [Alphaproteobacteria bacterium]
MAEIKLEGVTKAYGANRAVSELSLTVGDGEFFVLLGPTGAGKTTTLRLIVGLERPDAGRIDIDGADVADWSPAERDIALVFQYYSLYPRYTVRENLAFPLKSKIRKQSQGEIEERVARAASILRIEHLLDRKTDKLSGGEMQRVSIGRAIVREPRAFLMDEPLSNLDAKLRELLRAELKDLQMQLRSTFLFVTHDQVEAMSMGDRVAVMNEGRIAQVATPQEIYNHPRDIFVATFIGSPAMNVFDGEIAGGQVRALSGAYGAALDDTIKSRVANGAKLKLGIRSENVRIGQDLPVRGQVHHVENHGVEQIVTLKVNDHLLNATLPGTARVAIGEAVSFELQCEKMHYFDPTTALNLS